MNICVICMIILSACASQISAIFSVGNPLTEDQKCGNQQPSLVCNPHGVLDRDEVKALNTSVTSLLSTLADDYVCSDECKETRGGYVIGLAILKSINTTNKRTSVRVQAQDVAVSLRQTWHLGRCGNDALLLVLVNDKLLITSYGLKVRALRRILSYAGVKDTGVEVETITHDLTRTILRKVTDIRDSLTARKGLRVGSTIGIILGTLILFTIIGIVVICAFFFLLRGREDSRRSPGRDARTLLL